MELLARWSGADWMGIIQLLVLCIGIGGIIYKQDLQQQGGLINRIGILREDFAIRIQGWSGIG